MKELKAYVVYIDIKKRPMQTQIMDASAVVIAEDEEDAKRILADDVDLKKSSPERANGYMVAREIVKGADTIKCLKKGCLTWLYA